MNNLWMVLVMGFCLGIHLEARGMAAKPSAPRLLIAPAHHGAMQVAFDLLEKRDLVLVAYQNVRDLAEPALHVWDGLAWHPISLSDYAALNFVRMPPREIVMIGDDTVLPNVLVESAVNAQAANPILVPAQNPASVLNALGKIYGFSSQEWAWFAGRYRLELNDANDERRATSWYDKPFVWRPEEEGGGVSEPNSLGGPLKEIVREGVVMENPLAPADEDLSLPPEVNVDEPKAPPDVTSEPALFDAPIK